MYCTTVRVTDLDIYATEGAFPRLNGKPGKCVGYSRVDRLNGDRHGRAGPPGLTLFTCIRWPEKKGIF